MTRMFSSIRLPAASRRRHLQFERLEARCVLNGDVALAADSFTVRENGPQIQLDVLANDVFGSEYQGPRLITSVSYGSQGGRIEVTADRRGVFYTPPADFSGVETFVYAVDGQHTAQVQLSIMSPLANDQYTIPPDGQEHVLEVLANDPFWPGYIGPRKITAVSVGSHGGTIEISPDGKSIRYTPPDEDFGNETFTYVVDELYAAQVTIRVPSILEGNQYEMLKYEPPATLDVLANDPFGRGTPVRRRSRT
jgi:hypothetical protein